MSHEKELKPMIDESGFEAYEALMSSKQLAEHGETVYVKEELIKEEPCENETAINVFNNTEPISVTESFILVKEEPEDNFDVSEAARSLYAEHEVLYELVLGPRELRRPKYDSTISSKEIKAAVIPKRQPQDTATPSKVFVPHPEQQKQAKSTLESRPFCCEICKKNLKTKSNLVAHMTVHTSEKPYGCKSCNMRFKSKGNLDHHLQRHDERGQGPLTCDICQKEFPFQLYLDRHIQRVHSGTQYSCEIYNKRFGCTDALRKHVRQAHSGVKVKNVKPKLYPCEICNNLFNNKADATDHKYIHTGERPYVCDICKKKFRQKKRLVEHHKVNHAEKKIYRCYICRMRFLNRDDLTKHKVIHTVKRFTCDICDKDYCSKTSVIKHLRGHMGEQVAKPYWCEVCDKKFTTENYLSDHMRLHTEEQSLSCLICKKQFMTMNNLSDHMKVHTGEKLFSCDMCDKVFLIQSRLNKHKLTHMDKPYTCDVCKKQYKVKKFYTGHMDRCHLKRELAILAEPPAKMGEPYTCEVCKKQYREKQFYTAHMNQCQLKRELAILAEPPANQVRHQIVIPLPDDMTLSLTLDFE